MRKKYQRQFKKGAASFYVVAFSTLILVIIAASFTAIIIAQITRSSNDDLAKSAYDSALAGVEDAKLAYYNYQSCLEKGNGGQCGDIIRIVEQETPYCDMVGDILGREQGEVKVQESSAGNNMQQAYTCVKIDTSLSDYRATLSSENSTKVTRLRFDGVDANMIKKIKISWGVDVESDKYKFSNIDLSKQQVLFPAPNQDESSVAVPPTISFSFVQTADSFGMDDFNRVTTQGSGSNLTYHSNRGTLFLVPTDNADIASFKPTQDAKRNYIGACDGRCNNFGSNNLISSANVAKTNDKSVQNYPFAVYCPVNAGNEFVCSTTIELPEPVGGTRNNDTFIVVVSIPYGKPSTDYSLEFFCADNVSCNTVSGGTGDEESEVTTSQAFLKSVQVQVDSTGRANDLVRRVETRMEGADDYSSIVSMGPLELVGTGEQGEVLLDKDYTVTSEAHDSNYYSNCFEKVFNNNSQASCNDMPYMSK